MKLSGRAINVLQTLCVMCAASLIALVFYCYLYDCLYDDAYIHLRIARNFVESGQPYFNLDQMRMSSSSPVWLLVLSLLFYLFGAHLTVVTVLTFAVLICFLYIWDRLIANLAGVGLVDRLVFAVIALALVILPAIGGMESTLALALLGQAILSREDKPFFAGILLALAICTRLELVIFLLIFLANARHHVPPSRARFSAGVMVGFAPIALFLLFWYRTLIPETLWVKSLIYSLTWADFLQILVGKVYINIPEATGSILPVVHVILLVGTLGTIVVHKRRSETSRSDCLIVGGALILAAYYIRHVLLFAWYLPLFSVPLILGIYLRGISSRSIFWKCVSIVLAIPFVFRLVFNLGTLVSGQVYHYDEFLETSRVRQYRTIGAMTGQERLIKPPLLSEIGGFSWSFRGAITDAMGLVSKEMLPYHPLKVPEERFYASNGAISTAMVRDLKPEVVVSLEGFLSRWPDDPVYEEFTVESFPISDDPRANGSALWNSKYIVVLRPKAADQAPAR